MALCFGCHGVNQRFLCIGEFSTRRYIRLQLSPQRKCLQRHSEDRAISLASLVNRHGLRQSGLSLCDPCAKTRFDLIPVLRFVECRHFGLDALYFGPGVVGSHLGSGSHLVGERLMLAELGFQGTQRLSFLFSAGEGSL
jgi:hypothetical protein